MIPALPDTFNSPTWHINRKGVGQNTFICRLTLVCPKGVVVTPGVSLIYLFQETETRKWLNVNITAPFAPLFEKKKNEWKFDDIAWVGLSSKLGSSWGLWNPIKFESAIL